MEFVFEKRYIYQPKTRSQKLDDISKSVTSLKDSNKSNLETITKKLCDLEKVKRIHFAIDHVEYAEFNYYDAKGHSSSLKGSTLLRNILWFMEATRSRHATF